MGFPKVKRCASSWGRLVLLSFLFWMHEDSSDSLFCVCTKSHKFTTSQIWSLSLNGSSKLCAVRWLDFFFCFFFFVCLYSSIKVWNVPYILFSIVLEYPWELFCILLLISLSVFPLWIYLISQINLPTSNHFIYSGSLWKFPYSLSAPTPFRLQFHSLTSLQFTHFFPSSRSLY